MKKGWIYAIVTVLILTIAIFATVKIVKNNKEDVLVDEFETTSTSTGTKVVPGWTKDVYWSDKKNEEPEDVSGNYEEPVDKRVLENKKFENEGFTWTKTTIAYEEDDLTQFVNLMIDDKNTANSATADIMVDYRNMTASTTVTYVIYEKTGTVTEIVNYESNINALILDNVETTIDSDIRAGFETIISEAIYSAFH